MGAWGARAGPLVGRVQQLRELRRAIGAPEAAAVGIFGAPGIGKTRLAAEQARDLDSRRWRVERVMGSRASRELPLAPFAHLLARDAPPADPADSIHQVARELLVSADDRRLLLVADDTHLFDPTSIALLGALAHSNLGVLLLTARDDEPEPEFFRGLLHEGHATRIDLGPLDAAETDACLEVFLGGPVDDVTASRLRRLSGGNPLYLRELAAAGRDRGALAEHHGLWQWYGPLSLGKTLTETVDLRLDGLSDRERGALELIAIGGPLELGAVAALVDTSTLASLETLNLIVSDGDPAAPEIRFAHPFYSEVIRSSLGPLRVRALNRRLAASVLDPSRLTGTRMLRAAQWQLAGGLAHDSSLLARAAREAHRDFDHALAERLARKSLEVGGDSFEALFELGRALYSQSRAQEAEVVFAVADRNVTSGSDRVAVSMWRAANLFFELEDAEAATRVVTEALQRVRTRGHRLELTAYLATQQLFAGRPALALQTAAPALSDPDVEPAAERRAQLVSSHALAATGRTGAALAALDRASDLRLDERDRLHWSPVQALLAECQALEWAGRLEELYTVVNDAVAGVAAGELPTTEGTVALLQGRALLARGAVAASFERFRQATALLRRTSRVGVRAWSLSSLACAAAQAGANDVAQDALAEAERSGLGAVRLFEPDVILAQAWLSAAEGRIRSAVTTAIAAADLANERRCTSQELVCLHEATRFGGVGRVHARLVEVAAEVDGDLSKLLAAHATVLATGDADGLASVSRGLGEIGAHLLACEAAVEAAEAYEANGSATQGRRLRAQAQSSMRHCRGAATPVVRRQQPTPQLTPREHEVALLAARGCSSAEIADELVVSVRTVNNHLARVYTKLGVHRRRELEQFFLGSQGEPGAP